MARAMLHAAPDMLLKVSTRNDPTERIIGYATGLTFTVQQGQKMIFAVDSPFPYEISQSASPSFVRGSLTTWLPKGMTLESAGLVPYRKDKQGDNFLATSSYLFLRLYDRATNYLVYSIDHVKVSSYTVTVESKKLVRVQLNFEGILVTPGQVN